MWRVMKIEKGCDAGIDNQNDVATTPTVSAIWATKWFKFFALNRDATIATFSGCGIERYAIDECCHLLTLLSFSSLDL
jgi:fructosamine-3-kinase